MTTTSAHRKIQSSEKLFELMKNDFTCWRQSPRLYLLKIMWIHLCCFHLVILLYSMHFILWTVVLMCGSCSLRRMDGPRFVVDVCLDVCEPASSQHYEISATTLYCKYSDNNINKTNIAKWTLRGSWLQTWGGRMFPMSKLTLLFWLCLHFLLDSLLCSHFCVVLILAFDSIRL